MPVYYLNPRSTRRIRDHQSVQFNGGRRLPIDFQSDNDQFILRAAVPGLSADDLQIEILDDVLTLRVQPQVEETETKDESGRYLVREIRAGESMRRVCLPAPVNADKAEAKIENGLLTLRIPKADEVKPKKITVKA